jgi:hypothetical protein
MWRRPPDHALDTTRGHALIIYDERNPTMGPDGFGAKQWTQAVQSVREKKVLRRLSWQAMIRQWPDDDVLGWLTGELSAKYGLVP